MLALSVPVLTALLLLVPLLLVLRVRARRRNAAAAQRFSTTRPHSQPVHIGSGWRRPTALLLALALLVVGAAQPRFGAVPETLERTGRDIVVLLDVSQSMLAEEGGRTRLDRARTAIETLTDTVERGANHRLALIAFAGRAQLLCPLTSDYELFRQRLRTANPRLVPRPGSQVGFAVRQALHGFGGLSANYSDIILVTDGEDHGSAPLGAAQNAATLGVAVHAFAIGDAERGAPVPALVQPAEGPRAILAHDGSPVVSRMNPTLLAKLARRGGGGYQAAKGDPRSIVRLFNAHIDGKPRRVLSSVENETVAHRFQWFALLAVLLIGIEMLLRDAPARVPAATMRRTRAGLDSPVAAVLVVVSALGLLGFKWFESAASLNEQANELFAAGDFAGAGEGYSRAAAALTADAASAPLGDSATLRFNRGTAEFKQFAYRDAYASFSEAIDAESVIVASRARFNLGNVRYQEALNSMQTFQDAVTPAREAVEWFRAALEFDPDYEAARFNLELALLLRRQLSEQVHAIQNSPDATSRSGSGGIRSSFEAQAQESGSDESDSGSSDDEEDDSESGEGEALKADASNQAQPATQAEEAAPGERREMSAEDAESLVELMRSKAQDVAAQRMQWRRARMRDTAVSRTW